jgi:hypothetical protein
MNCEEPKIEGTGQRGKTGESEGTDLQRALDAFTP